MQIRLLGNYKHAAVPIIRERNRKWLGGWAVCAAKCGCVHECVWKREAKHSEVVLTQNKVEN